MEILLLAFGFILSLKSADISLRKLDTCVPRNRIPNIILVIIFLFYAFMALCAIYMEIYYG